MNTSAIETIVPNHRGSKARVVHATRSVNRVQPSLRCAAAAWLVVAIAGQLLFATYVALFYGLSAAQGHPERWNEVLDTGGYKPGDTSANLVLASHLLFAVAVMLSGALQLVPAIRSRAPRFHRWNGRFFVISAALEGAGGFFMVWTRATPGDLGQHLGISLNAILIVAFAYLAWHYARARRFDTHRRWALRLFLVVSGVWFFRIGLMLWIVANHGPVGFDAKTFTGPILTFLSFAQYLVPLGVLQLYFRAQSSRSAYAQHAMAGVLAVLTLATMAGIASAAAILWLPHL